MRQRADKITLVDRYGPQTEPPARTSPSRPTTPFLRRLRRESCACRSSPERQPTILADVQLSVVLVVELYLGGYVPAAALVGNEDSSIRKVADQRPEATRTNMLLMGVHYVRLNKFRQERQQNGLAR